MKHVGEFVNVIRILQRMYSFFDLPRNYTAFSINNFHLIPAKAVICFPTVHHNFILFTILFLTDHMCLSEGSFKDCSFTKVDYFAVTTVNFIGNIFIIFCSYSIVSLQSSLCKVLSV